MGRGGPGLARSARVRGLPPMPAGAKCRLCDGGEEAALCTCEAVDRCPDVSDKGRQCIQGAGHEPMRHVDSAGNFWA